MAVIIESKALLEVREWKAAGWREVAHLALDAAIQKRLADSAKTAARLGFHVPKRQEKPAALVAEARPSTRPNANGLNGPQKKLAMSPRRRPGTGRSESGRPVRLSKTNILPVASQRRKYFPSLVNCGAASSCHQNEDTERLNLTTSFVSKMSFTASW